VLDVGWGCGATTLAAARAVAEGEAVGIDLSESMIDRARQRALDEGIGNARFEVADAQTFHLPVPFDATISRFGLMFFEDPVAAFANLCGGLWPGGRLAFVCWQEMAVNEWMTVPATAALAHVPMPELGEPDAPGPYSLADADRVREILTGAGLVDVDLESVEEKMLLGGRGTVGDAVEFLSHTGMGQALLGDAAPAVREQVFAAVRESLLPYVTDDGVRVGAAAWLVTARRS